MTWDPPKKANGIIIYYLVTIEGNPIQVSPLDHMHTFMKLLANTSYVLTVKASTSAGEGDESSCSINTQPESGMYGFPETGGRFE